MTLPALDRGHTHSLPMDKVELSSTLALLMANQEDPSYERYQLNDSCQRRSPQ
jgi:hypothetical protein